MQVYVCMNNMTCKTNINAYTYICIITLKSDPQNAQTQTIHNEFLAHVWQNIWQYIYIYIYIHTYIYIYLLIQGKLWNIKWKIGIF